MNHINVTIKRLSLYIIGLFFLALGVSFSIQADLGVSPVSSLAYAFALASGLSVGMMTIVANVLFIMIQVVLSKQFNFKESIVQLVVAFLFGFFMDLSLFLVQLVPMPESIFMRWAFLIISLFVVAIGLLGYFTTKFPLMPYDQLTFVISEKFKLKVGKAKISSDLINVCVAGVVCVVTIHSLGAVGIGTVVAAYFIGKILGWIMKYFQLPLSQWMNKNKVNEVVEKKSTSLSS